MCGRVRGRGRRRTVEGRALRRRVDCVSHCWAVSMYGILGGWLVVKCPDCDVERWCCEVRCGGEGSVKM